MVRNIKQEGTAMKEHITIGMDMGDKNHKAVALGGDGRESRREEVANTREAMAAFLGGFPGATLAIETGTHCRWVCALASGMGLKVLVANARKVALITRNSRKSDWNDAAMLADIAYAKPSLLRPVSLRGAADQRLMRLAKGRDALVRCRTAIVNQVRGFCKAEGVRLRACSPEAFPSLRGDIPEEAADVSAHLLATIKFLNGKIKRYDRILEKALGRLRGEDADIVTQIPGVGTVTAAVFLAAIGDAGSFGGDARAAGPFLGLVPKSGQSGDKDPQLRISKEGNSLARRTLVNSASHIMGPFGKDSDLRRHGMRIAARGGKNAKKRARVAVARRLAVTMLAMLRDRSDYRPIAEGSPPEWGAPSGGSAATAGGREGQGA